LSELGIIHKVTLVALAERMEEVYRVGDPYPLFIDRNSPALKVLQQIRDEAHRFGITFHRNLRSKAQIQSVLRSIKGVGEKTEQRLLLRFGSVARIAAASMDDIAELVGPSLAKTIHEHLNKNEE
jgi:excinuclease ABC subunit C